jgi:hypothetical protein
VSRRNAIRRCAEGAHPLILNHLQTCQRLPVLGCLNQLCHKLRRW